MVILIILPILISFLIGYIYGKNTGIKKGMELSLLYAPLQCRIESMQSQISNVETSADCYKTSSMIK